MGSFGIYAGGALLIAAVIFILWVRRQGYKAAIGDAARKEVDHARQAAKVREDVRRAPDRDLDDELRGA